MSVTACPPITIPIREAARRLGVHENTVRNWADQQVLDSFRTPTGRRKVPLSEVERLEREMFGAPTEPLEMTGKTPVPPQAGQLQPADSYPS